MMNVMVPPALVISFIVLCVISLKESAADEREQLHNYKAGRISYLVGLGVLVFVVVLQYFKHSVDPWLLGAAVVMIVAKFASKFYQKIKN